MSNVTFKPADGATVTVAGIEMVSGHRYGKDGKPCYDYVLDDSTESTANSYRLAHKVYNITFENITFTAKCYVDGSDRAETVINGFTFKGCTFNINNISSDAYQAINYRCNKGIAAVRNLVVDGCTFNSCYQGVYTQNVYGVTVKNSTFNTTQHNAIAIQHENATFNHGAVVITNNSFNNIGDRIIRFGNVGADTQITITGNTATESGDDTTPNPQVIKAETLAAGITYNISGNNWGTKNGINTVVYNTELQNR